MEVFNCRSPFIISVNGASTQVETKLELFIWSFNETEPTTPTKVLQKTRFSDTQYINHYNISPFVYDLILPYDINSSVYNVKCIIYYKDEGDTEFTYIYTYNYLSVNGYSEYNEGTNAIKTTNEGALPLLNPDINRYINYYRAGVSLYEPTIDVIFDFTVYDRYRVTIESGEYGNVTYIDAGDYDTDYAVSSFYMSAAGVPEVANGNDFIIEYRYEDNYYELIRYTLTPICEIKYTPYILDFVNNWGGLQKITLFKNSTKTIDVKGSDYNTNTFTSGYPNYDAQLGQKRVFNKNGTTTIKCNTGWIKEIENANIKDIMLSEYLYLRSADSGLSFAAAVTLKNSSMLMKTHLNEKVINYELEFEVANSLINNVV
jgi:hypothetical protein